MLFNSPIFLFAFLPLTLLGFFQIGRRSAEGAAVFLTLASLFFYGYWTPVFLSVLVPSILFNYTASRILAARRQGSPAVLTAAVAANLALLAYFKYRGFFEDGWRVLTGASSHYEKLVLPLGISFFTFTQIAFLVDTARGKAREYSLTHYVLFISYFPHLIAGPIIHHAQVMPQFAAPATFRWHWPSFNTGLAFFLVGLGKKVVVADTLANYANPVFDLLNHGQTPWFVQSWVGVLAYAFQLYFDFSGYSDMAVGLSKMFNITLPFNFDSPYKAASIIDFWKRWHMTLSQFLRDYLYIPLGGNRHGTARRYLNLFLTMLLGGLWHGAAWTFVLWGGLHGFYLTVNHLFRELRHGSRPAPLPRPITRILSTGLTFLSVTLAWAFFRADSMPAAIRLCRSLLGLDGVSLPKWKHLSPAWISRLHQHGITFDGMFPAGAGMNEWFLPVALSAAMVWLLPNSQQWIRSLSPGIPAGAGEAGAAAPPHRILLASGLIGLLLGIDLLFINTGRSSMFLYFQF